MKRLSFLVAFIFLLPVCCMATDNTDVDIHGFLSQGYIKSRGNNYFSESRNGTFEFNEMGINFINAPTPGLRVGIQLFARDLGDTGNDQIMVDWVMGDYQIRPELGIRAGKIKVPMGLYNTTRDIDMIRTVIFMPQSVYPEEQRDANLAIKGAGFYGRLLGGALGSLEYEGAYGTIEIDENSIGNKMIMDQGGMVGSGWDIDYKYAVGLIWNAPIEGLRFGVTHQGLTGEVNGELRSAGISTIMDIKFYEVQVFSGEYTIDRLSITYEFLQRHMKMDVQPIGIKVDEEANGQYLKASYAFTEWFELGAYYSEFYPRKDDKNGSEVDRITQQKYGHRAWYKDWAASMKFTINSNWTAKLEGHYLDGTASLLKADNPDGFSRYWSLCAAKLTYSF